MTEPDPIPPHDDKAHPTHCICGNPWREVDGIWCCPRCLVDELNRLSAHIAELESGIHPAKKPMEGGFSMDQFMAGVSPEDAAALADAIEEAERHEAEFDSGITESQLMDRLKEALDQRDEATARTEELETRLREIGDIAHDKSTGPAVHDRYWDIRALAYELL